MKKKNYIYIILMILILTSSKIFKFETTIESKNDFITGIGDQVSISIYQNDKVILPNNEVYKLNKEPFSIVFKHGGNLKVLINSWTSSESFDDFENNISLEQVLGFENTGMAEGLKNSNLNIVLSPDCPQMWFYDNEDENRFNNNIVIDNAVISTRTVEYLQFSKYLVGKKHDPFLVQEFESDNIYICIAGYIYNREERKREVYSMYRMHINFN